MSATASMSPVPLAGDTRALASLRERAGSEPQAAAREAARQFEALFMNELMKSMRASIMKPEGDSPGAALGTEMLDAQWALQMSGRRGGLSEAISQHLERQMGLAPGPIPVTVPVPVPGGWAASVGSGTSTRFNTVPDSSVLSKTPPTAATTAPKAAPPSLEGPVRLPQKGAAAFVQQHSAAAQRAEQQTGVPAAFMVAQAAHETGWGRKEIRHADGSPSYNLFGIKAGGHWRGPVAEVTTTEYVGGQPRKGVAAFRAYSSYAESFADYAQLLKTSPRYQGALQAATQASGFAQGLQRAGYATDPEYAAKLTRVINTTLRLQRSVGA